MAPSPSTVTSTAVRYVDLAGQHRPLKAEILDAVGRVLDHGRFILGPEVEELERRFADLCGARFAVGVNSGTDALVLALRALGLGPGDEVITVPNSFIATTAAIRLAGARPVLVDVGDDGNLDPEKIESALGPRTRAILPVHLTGRPADMDPILEIARSSGLPVVEDCAQAVLAEYRGRRVGSFGRMGCFSFHPLKTLNCCGDGGILTTDDGELDRRLRVLRNLGLETRENCVAWSGNSRLDTLEAAILLVKLRRVEGWTEKRRAHARYYREALRDIPGLRTPEERSHEKAVYHTFVIRAERRDELRQHLAENGVETAIHYPLPIHLQSAAAELGYGPGSFPEAEEQARSILSLPIYPELEQADLEHVAAAIRRFYGK
jgi:dTDP-4-amino-4,6-dideoxygalactose transaminase